MKIPPVADSQPSPPGECPPTSRALMRDGFTCQLCGSQRNLEAHHIRYRSRGGDDSETNLITLCRDCHVAVHASLASVRARVPDGERTS